MIDNIEVTAYENVKSRYQRLERVIGYICALSENDQNNELLQKVEKLHVHKGILQVHWLKQPTEKEKIYFVKAWLSSIGDGADNIEHFGL